MNHKKNKIATFHDNIIKHIVSFIKTYYGFFVFILLLLILWFFVISPAIEISKANLPPEKSIIHRNNHIKTVAQLLGGIVLLIGIYFAWRRIQVYEESQMTERFTRAINHLGNKKPEVRLGGIYALERIAKDYPDNHPQIMEILAAYVREKAKIDKPEAKKEIGVKEDIQSILTVIGRRNWKYDKEGQIIDLRNTNLQDYKFDSYFKKINLSNSKLKGADFHRTKLQNSNFMGADLEQTDFRDAELQGADLGATNLKFSFLCGANIHNIQHWRGISDFEGTEIADIINAPKGFIEFAKKNGAKG